MEYIREAMGELTEEALQDLIQRAFETDGWLVRNVHQTDRGHEEGADLYCERQGKKRLVAVKIRPVKKDINQLDILAKRSEEGELYYAYVADPTVTFQKKMEDLAGVVSFLGPSELHSLLLQGEVVDYLVLYFGTLSTAKEMAKAVTILCESREVILPEDFMRTADLKSIWILKDAVLKMRAAIGIVAMRWDDDLMRRTEERKEEFDSVLDDVVRDLDNVQRFTGGNLAQAFQTVQDTTPHVLSLIWKVVRPRTGWMYFAAYAEKMSSPSQVYELARRFWALPGASSPLPHSKWNRTQMLFFYSGIVGILRNLAQAAKDLDDGIDWAWQDMCTKHKGR